MSANCTRSIFGARRVRIDAQNGRVKDLGLICRKRLCQCLQRKTRLIRFRRQHVPLRALIHPLLEADPFGPLQGRHQRGTKLITQALKGVRGVRDVRGERDVKGGEG